jgi:hypothetical protein
LFNEATLSSCGGGARVGAAAGQRQRADGAGVAVQAGAQVAVDHQAAADEGIDEDVEEARRAAPAAGHQLGHAGGGGVFQQVHGPVAQGFHLGAQVGGGPARGHFGRHVQQGLPAAERERHGQADTLHPLARRGAEAAADVVQAPADLGQQLAWLGVAVVQRPAFAHRAGEVDEQHVHAAAADLDAHRVRAIGVQRQRHRRLAHAAALRLALDQQAVVQQALGDQRDGLRRELRQPRDLGPGQRAMQADGLQHHAFIELAQAALAGAARAQVLGFGGGLLRDGARGLLGIGHAASVVNAPGTRPGCLPGAWRRSSPPRCRSC